MSKFVKNELDAYSAAGTIAEEVLSAIKTVVAFEGQKREKERYSKEVRSAHANNRRRALFSSTGQAVVWLLVFSCYGLSFWYGFSLNKRDAFSKAENGYTPGKLLTVCSSTQIVSSLIEKNMYRCSFLLWGHQWPLRQRLLWWKLLNYRK